MTNLSQTVTSSITSSTARSKVRSRASDSSKIYVRWITAGRALEHRSLKSLPAERISVPTSTTVAELKKIANERLYTENTPAEDRPPSNTTAELFLLNCYLSSLGPGSIKLGDLDLTGSKDNPLDIFVVPVQADNTGVGAARPDRSWGFTSTDRGKATFYTSLTMFLEEIRDGKVKLNKALSVIWEITHFPPASLALQQLFEDGLKVKPFPCAVFASSFREIALRIVPPWVSPSSESVLEASRQVFAWLHFLSSESAGSSGEVNEVLVHKVELRTIEGSPNGADQPGRFDHDIRTEIRISDLSVDGLSSADLSCKQVLVSKERLDDVKPETLAAAFWGSYQSPYNFYFGFPPNAHRFHEHARLDLLHPQDFDNLLQTTNEVDVFKMIGPLQLGACTSSTLPIITLDSEGWVSKYDQQDAECSQREFYTENIFRKEVLTGSDPGQHLLQKLSPLIEKRKKEGNWELDSWDEASKAIDVRTPEEGEFCLIVCLKTI